MGNLKKTLLIEFGIIVLILSLPFLYVLLMGGQTEWQNYSFYLLFFFYLPLKLIFREIKQLKEK